MTDPPELAEDVVAGRAPGEPVVRGQGAAVAVVALGGALGALARAGIGALAPSSAGAFPTSTVAINVLGSLLMGVLVVVVTEVRDTHPLVRPFLGVGVLGGFTTFSSFTVEALRLLQERHLLLGAAALVATAIGAVGAAALGMALTRRLMPSRGEVPR